MNRIFIITMAVIVLYSLCFKWSLYYTILSFKNLLFTMQCIINSFYYSFKSFVCYISFFKEPKLSLSDWLWCCMERFCFCLYVNAISFLFHLKFCFCFLSKCHYFIFNRNYMYVSLITNILSKMLSLNQGLDSTHDVWNECLHFYCILSSL